MKRFGLIGHPIAHSLSPALFKAGYAGKYPYELIETGDFEEAYNRFLNGYDGINVTAPFKELAYAKADILSEECRIIKATNLLVRTPEGVKAYVAGNVATTDGVEYVPVAEYGKNIVAAGVPVVLAAEDGTYAIGVGGDAEEFEGVNVLNGVLKSQTVSGSNVYLLKGTAFEKRTSASGSVAANTAYYTSDSAASVLELKEGEVTSVDSVLTEGVSLKFYDLKGNLVENPVRGIYVTSEGKKVLVF